MIQNLEHRVNCTRFRIGSTINKPLQASLHERAGAHRAWLNRNEELAVPQPMITHKGSRFPQSHDLGMCGWIAIANVSVPASTDHLAIPNHHGTDRHLADLQASLGGTEGFLHPDLV